MERKGRKEKRRRGRDIGHSGRKESQARGRKRNWNEKEREKANRRNRGEKENREHYVESSKWPKKIKRNTRDRKKGKTKGTKSKNK